MNQSTLDRTRFERIEAYLLDRMERDELLRFQEELLEDSGLRSELELQRENILAIELGGVERQLRQMVSELPRQRTRGSGSATRLLKYAAAIAVLLSATLWYLNKPTANEQLYAEFHVADPGLPVPMSASNKPEFHDAMVDLKMGEYEKALAKWQLQLVEEPDSDTLRYYIATAHLELGHLEEAVGLYAALVDDGTSNFRYKAEWYMLLAELRAGNEVAVLDIRPAAESPYAARIAQIQERIGPP